MSILAQIGTKVGSEIKNLDIRLSSAENAIVNLGGQQPPPTGNFTIEPVTWTNLTEIDFGGYVADPSNDGSNRGSASNPVKLIVLTSVNLGGTIFSAGKILNGVGGGGTNGSLIRMEDPDDPRDRPYTTTNQNTGTWAWHDWVNRGTTWEYAKENKVVSGGSVQTFTGGSIEKISGVDGYNAGASSVQKIDGQSNGYVQFQIGTPNKSVRVGLVGIDSDFEVDPPFKMNFGRGTIDLYSPWLANYETYESGDWFRIRHYSANNEIKFQKREDVYGANASLRSSTYSVQDDSDVGNYVVFLKTDVGQQISGTDVAVALNRGYEIVGYSSASNSLKVLDDNGNNAWLALNNTSSDRNRGDAWEFSENIGQDYFTFYTHPTFSNGNDLYLDTSFHTTGSRLNDVQIAYE